MPDALVVGTGPNWKKEFNAAYTKGVDIIAVNGAIKDLPIDEKYAISNHPEFIAKSIDLIVPPHGALMQWRGCSSGFLGIGLALDKGYDNVYVAGIPLSPGAFAKDRVQMFIAERRELLQDKLILPEHYWWAKVLPGVRTYTAVAD